MSSVNDSLLSLLLLTQSEMFFTGDGDAGDEGYELLEIQLVVFVFVQIFDDPLHGVGAFLALTETDGAKLKTHS